MFSCRIDDNLSLVLPQMRNAEEITAVVRENLEELKPWMPWAVDDYDIESAKAYIQRTLREFAESGAFSTSIVLDGRIVGSVGFHNLDTGNKSAEIGYWLSREGQGKGVVTRCCRALIDHLFNDLGLNRIQINCNVENVKSRAVPERLGFQLEGIRRQVEFIQGRFGDWAVYAMLAGEWKKIVNS